MIVVAWKESKEDGSWKKYSYKEYWERIRCAAKAFIKVCCCAIINGPVKVKLNEGGKPFLYILHAFLGVGPVSLSQNWYMTILLLKHLLGVKINATTTTTLGTTWVSWYRKGKTRIYLSKRW